MKKHIPNAITCLNLFSGCVGIVFAFNQEFKAAAVCVLLSGIFDFFDGLVARALRVRSDIGKDLDSLADVISFGLLPGVILFRLLQTPFPGGSFIPYAGFIVTVFSAWRLAKFNNDQRQTIDFIGLSTPMNTLFIASLPFIALSYPAVIYHPALLLCVVAGSSGLLVSELRLFSLKFPNLSWQGNRFKFIFLLVSALLAGLLKFIAVPLILFLYFIFSALHFRLTPER